MRAIIIFGDSLGFGRGATLHRGWAQMLKEKVEKNNPADCVYNLSIPGDTAFTLLRRADTELQARTHHLREGDETIVIINSGGNDSKQFKEESGQLVAESSEEHLADNMIKIFDVAKRYSKKIMMVGFTPVDEEKVNPWKGNIYFFNDRMRSFNEVIKRTCKEKQVPFLDQFDEWLFSDYKRLISDGIHPNDEGYARSFSSLVSFMEQKGLL